jgi:hypothetical protein
MPRGPAKALLRQKPPKIPKNDAYDEANSMSQRYGGMQRLEVEDSPYGTRKGGRGEGMGGRDFPVQLNKPKSGRDTRLSVRAAYNAQRSSGADFGQLQATDADLEVFEDYERQKQRISFEQWLAHQFDLNDPATAKLVEDMMPEYFDKRMEAIEHQAELQKNLAMIRLRGPRSKTDMMLLYLLSTGQVQLPAGAIFEPDKWSYDSKDLMRGLFNPRRYRPVVTKLSRKDPIGTLIEARPDVYGGAASYTAPGPNVMGGFPLKPPAAVVGSYFRGNGAYA